MSEVKIDLKLITASFEKGMKNVQNQIKTSSGAVSVFTGNLAAMATGSVINGLSSLTRNIGSLGIAAIQNASKIETMTTQLGTLTGSTEVAQKTIESLQRFAASTPFQLDGLVKTSSQLISFGFQAENIEDKLQKIGDVAAATGTPLSDLGLIFGQVSASGKLTGERLLQLQERGIPILSALGKEFGKTDAEIRDMVTQGIVSFDDFERAFNSLSEEGGVAFGGMQKQSETLEGKLSTLKDNFFLLSSSIGKAFLPVIKDAVTEMIGFIQTINLKTIQDYIVKGILVAADSFGYLVSKINPVATAINGIYNAFRIVQNGITAGVSTIGILFEGLAIKLSNAFLGVINALPESIVPESWKTKLEEELTVQEERLAMFKEQLMTDSKDINESFNNMITPDTIISEDKLEDTQDRINEWKELFKQANKDMSKEQDLANKLDKKNTQKHQKEMNNLNKEYYDNWKSFITEFKSFEESTGSERIANTKDTLGTISSLTSQNNSVLFEIGKAAAISQATIDGITAVQKALASAPPPFNFALAATVGVATAANVSKIASTKRPERSAGNFADGGFIGGTSFVGDRLTANVNSGEAILNTEQQREFMRIANGNSTSGNGDMVEAIKELGDRISNLEIVVVADDNEIARSASRGVQNGIEIGTSR